jgi:hypothetical protein
MISKTLLIVLLVSSSALYAQYSIHNPNYFEKKFLKAEVEMLEEFEYYPSSSAKKKESIKKFSKAPKSSTVYYFDQKKRIVQVVFKDRNLKAVQTDKFEYSEDGKILTIKGYDKNSTELSYLKVLKFDHKDRLADLFHYVHIENGSTPEMAKLSRSQYDYDDKNRSFVHTETNWTGDDSLIVSKMGTLNANGLEDTYVIQYDKESDFKELKYNKYNENNDLVESVFLAYKKNPTTGKIDTTQTLIRQYKYDDKKRQINEYIMAGDIQDDISIEYDNNGFIKSVKIINIKAEKLKETNYNVEYKLDSKNNFVEMKSFNAKEVEKIIKRKIKYFN